MEDHDWVPSDGKQPCGVGARAPGFGPNGHYRGGGACSRSREGDVSPGDCFAARLVWLAAGRSPGSGGAQGRRGGARPAGCSWARAGACTCVHGGEVQGVCTARARRAPVPALALRHRGPAPLGENTAQTPGRSPGDRAGAQG